SSLEPRQGSRKPIAVFIRVVLPMPLRPRSATASPARTSSETPKRIGVAPYPAWTPDIFSRLALRGSQIGFDHLRIVPDLLRGALGDLLAEVQDRDPAGDAHDDRHVVLDQEHREAARRRASRARDCPAGRTCSSHGFTGDRWLIGGVSAMRGGLLPSRRIRPICRPFYRTGRVVGVWRPEHALPTVVFPPQVGAATEK